MSLTLNSSIKKIVTKSGTEITKVVRKSDGAVLWKKSAPYYAIQNGSLVNCPNAVTEQQGGHSNRSGVITLQTTTVYGAYGHTNSSDNYNDYWGAYTGNLSTEGCAKLSFTFATFETTVSAEVRDYWVYGDGVEIKHETISSVTAYQEYIASRTVDVSNYSTVAVRVRVQDTNKSDLWMGAGFIEVRLHD